MSKEPPTSVFWSIVLILSANIIIFTGFLLNLVDFVYTISAMAIINILLIIFVIIGTIRHKSGKYAERESTTISRKMFNIVAAIVVAFFIVFFDKWLCFFVVTALMFAFGFHEVILVGLKRKTLFTDTFNALGRQVEPGKPYLSSFLCLFSFFVILLLLLIFFTLVGEIVVLFLVITLTWGIGDTFAYLVGTRWGKHKLRFPFNKNKSVEGSLGFTITGIMLALLFFSPFFQFLFNIPPILEGIWYIIISIAVGFIGAFFEALARQPILDDNLITPIGLGVVLIGLALFF
ncbi:MAG: phosphatidate cytidylyltransferase [Candidatus Helarchaeota archaeon]